MENKKLIKSIKKQVIKSLENDLKNSVLKELYGSSYKKQIKKLRKQILKEVQKEIFGSTKTAKKKKSKKPKSLVDVLSKVKKTTSKKSREMIEMQILAGIPVSKEERDKVGLNQDNYTDEDSIAKMATAARGFKPAIPITPMDGKTINPKSPTAFTFPSEKVTTKLDTTDASMDELMRAVGKATRATPEEGDLGPEIRKNINKLNETKNSPKDKEEIAFFIGKLKKAIQELSQNEKDIKYRKKGLRFYNFTFDIIKDFELSFSLDLDMYTYGATINEFDFKIDDFRFDEKFFDTLDVIDVLGLVGLNLMKYINEINGINDTIDMDKISTPTTKSEPNKKVSLRRNTKVSTFIPDKRIVSILNNNDIKYYGQLKEFAGDLTAIKGVGEKTANKIEEYIKR